MILTISDDNTVSTSSALIIKAQTYKCSNRCELEKNIECSIKARIKIAQLSSAEQLRYEAIEVHLYQLIVGYKFIINH
ncbi:unnamed protein product [Adineta steineri]|uniref:Uncharacterized protein n=1 Tax=Adineta steineri TaxID=433720 RepID=A0A815M2T9_9BILA|nr:unnamed protein product [Adineta steineri]